MAQDPRNLPAVGDELAGGVVARTVATAEGLEVTIRLSTVEFDGYSDEDRPVSIPQKVDPQAHELEGADRAEAAEQEEQDEREAAEKVQAENADRRQAALKETAKAPAHKPAQQAKNAGK